MYESNIFKTILKFVAFFICVGLVIYGQKTVGIPYLMIQIVGVIGIMILIYLYNRKYK
ncbi:hypothetical protein [uncultured Faecalicoccus sp.]|uniref:DUF6903 family protein n=1 Tax=uncultured Faecalicoccus sp. TaxID=1971760 RepID=UPI002637D29E|nr:hypothetical protein [uncultured Faecalicoccus sp.]